MVRVFYRDLFEGSELAKQSEEVAARTPEKIHKEFIDPGVGLQPFQARKLAFALGLKSEQISEAVKFMTALYRG